MCHIQREPEGARRGANELAISDTLLQTYSIVRSEFLLETVACRILDTIQPKTSNIFSAESVKILTVYRSTLPPLFFDEKKMKKLAVFSLKKLTSVRSEFPVG